MGEGYEPACRLRLPRVCLHLAHPSMYGTTRPYLPFGCQPSRQCVVSMRRTSRPFPAYTAPPARRGRRIHAVRELWQGNRPTRTKMPLRWQDVANMRFPGARRWQGCALMRSWPDWQWQYTRAVRSRVPCRDKIPPRCVPGRLPMAKYSRNAFPGGNPWQVLRSMHPKSGLGRENRQFAARFARHASEMSWFWQDMRAMHPKSPANRLSGTHGAKILPGRTPFRCTDPSNHAWRADLAIL